MESRRSEAGGTALVLLAAVLWGSLGVAFSLQGSMGTPPLVIAFWRALVAAVAMVLGLAVARPAALRIHARELPFFAAYGLLSVSVLFYIYPIAVGGSSVAVAAVLLYTAPAWVVLMGALWLGERLTGRKILALVLCFAGTALVAGVGEPGALKGTPVGLLAGLGSGLAYATVSLFGRLAPARYEATTLTTWMLLAGTAFLALPAAADLPALLEPWRSARGVGLLLYVGLLPTAGSYLFYTMGLRRLGDAGRASIMATLEPFVGAALGLLVLGQALSPAQGLGGALVLSGVVLLQLRKR